MPMTRYEIRNEYSLADPELYRAADKDDPEALLEGVAMAGLVGVLRQLGDLAEFAAEIFHDLHEEVMTTAARGHSLMIRVQQLEAEVPAIERAFLSQSDHSSLFYNAGVDWHPNLRLDQNLVTQGDLPRFVMDSYEECRGPPRLFLLDKFDVAGAGACLKRYTDPSFFKVETSGMTSSDGQREKKIRKAKKKGPRWRNGETPKVLPSSHAKLHQLFLEEPVKNVVSNPGRHAKLKRRLNGFPFDSRTGKSYMEKVLRTPSPEHTMLHEVPVSSPLMLPAYDNDESDFKVFEVGPVSLHRDSVERKRSPPSPPYRRGTMLNLSIYEPEEVSVDEKISEASDIPSTLDKVAGEKDIAVDGETKVEGSLAGYQSDDIASEIDNYVDAPSTMGSEMDTDSELRVKSDFSSYIKKQPFVSDANENHLQSQSSDSQSTGDSIISDEGNISSKKDIFSSLSSDSQSTSAENIQLEKKSVGGFLSTGVPEMGLVDASSNQKADDEDISLDQHPKLMVSGDTCSSPDAVTNHSDFEQPTSSFCSNNSIPTLAHSNSEFAKQGRLREPRWDETVSNSDDEEKKTNLTIDPTCSPSASYSKLHSGDYSPRSFSGENLVDKTDGENVPSLSIVPDIFHHRTDNTVTISADLLQEDESGREDLDLFENISATLNTCDVLYSDRKYNQHMSSIKNIIPGKLDDAVPKLPETFESDYTENAHNGDNIMSTVFEGENLINKVVNEDLDVFLDVPIRVSCTKETAFGKETMETSLANAQTVEVEDHHSNSAIDKEISSDNLIPSHIESSSDRLDTGLDAFDRNFIAEEERNLNGTRELGTPISCEDVELQGAGIRINVTPNDIAAPESSCSTPEDLENPAGSSDTIEKDGVTLYTSTTELQITEISCSADPKSLNEVHVLLNESGSRTDQLETGNIASPVPIVSDNAARDNVGLDKTVEEHIPSFEDSGLYELEKENILSGSHKESGLVELDENCLSESHMELGLMEGVGEIEANISDSDTMDNGHSILEVSQTVPNSYLDLDAENSVDIVNTPQIQPSLEPNGLDTEEKLLHESRFENQLSDASSLLVASNIKETILQDKIALPTNQPDEELPDSREVISDLSSPLPINHQQILDHGYPIVEKKSASTFSVVNSPPLVSELQEPTNCDIDVSGYSEDRFGSTFPPSNIFSEANQINLEELPPLPPLPPVQWRMGKLFSREISLPINVSSSHEEMNNSLIQIAPETTSKEEKVEYNSSSFEGTSVHETIDFPTLIPHASSTTEEEITKRTELLPREISPPIASAADVSSAPEENHSLIQISTENASKEEKVKYTPSSLANTMVHETTNLPPKLQHASRTIEGEIEKHNELFPLVISPPLVSADDVTPSTEENPSLIQFSPDSASKEDKVEYTSSSLKANSLHETIDIPPKFENEPQQLVIPSTESGFTLPAEEDGVANGNRTVKLPRPRNPLMDEVAALDKSKLRKATERVIPQIQQVDDRDSLLQQIRAKSFNLKPAVQSKPSIRGPNTNLRVAAILEKANAIRQAFAGSDDEDDEDSWSDS